MKVKKEYRPIFSLDKYFSFFVLGCSIVNLLSQSDFSEQDFNSIGSILLSLLGLLAFWRAFRQKIDGEYLILIWSVFQLPVIMNYLEYNINLAQFFSFLVGITFENQMGDSFQQFSVNLNLIALLFATIAFFRLKNRFYYQKMKIKFINGNDVEDFETSIIGSYKLGTDSKLLIADKKINSKNYVIQVKKGEERNLLNANKEYLLCEVETELLKKDTIQPYAFRQLGKVKIEMPDKK